MMFAAESSLFVDAVATRDRLALLEMRHSTRVTAMYHRLSDSTHFQRLVIREKMSAEELHSGPYIRFSPTDAWRPNINIYESRQAFLICVDLAGMKTEEINVDVNGNIFSVRGERSAPMPTRASEIGVHLMEIDTGVFCRQVELPTAVDRDTVSAHYRDGLLWVTLPKIK